MNLNEMYAYQLPTPQLQERIETLRHQSATPRLLDALLERAIRDMNRSWERAILSIDEVKTIAIQLHDTDRLYYCTLYEVACIAESGDSERAWQLLSAIGEEEMPKSPHFEGWYLLLHGFLHYLQGDWVNAMVKARQAYEFLRPLGDYNGMNFSLSILAGGYTKFGNFKAARELVFQMAEFARALEDSAIQAITYCNVVRLHQEVIHLVSAYLIKGLRACRQWIATDDTQVAHTVLSRLLVLRAKWWAVEGNPAQAERYLQQAQVEVMQLGVPVHRASLVIYEVSAEIAVLAGEIQTAIAVLHEALGEATQHPDLRAEQLIHQRLAYLYQRQHQFKLAFYHLQQAQRLHTSKLDESTIEELAAIKTLQTKLELEKTHQELSRERFILTELVEEFNRQYSQTKLLRERDSLTGLYNRTALETYIAPLLVQCRILHTPLSVVFFDLDNFKQVNDTYGHLKGDMVLRQIGLMVMQLLPSFSMAMRYGGEEFVVFLPHHTLNEAGSWAERLRTLVQQAGWATIDPNLQVTLSLGVSLWNGVESLEQLLHRADSALYLAKREGKNRVVVQPDSDD